MNKAIFFSLLTLIFLSACVSRDVRVAANNGLEMSRFYAEPGAVDSGEIFSVYMEVENVGGRTANAVVLEMLSNAFENENSGLQRNCVDKSGQPIICPLNIQLPQAAKTEVIKKYYFEKFSPPAPELGRPGDFRAVNWELQAPFLPYGAVKDFRILGRMSYEYSTSSSVSIPVYTKSEFRQRKGINSMEIRSTNGPVKIEVSGPKQIVVDTAAADISKNEVVVYTITMTNTGDGIPVTRGVNGLVKGSIKFSGGITPLDCLKQDNMVVVNNEQPPLSRPSQQVYDSSSYLVRLPESDKGLILRDGRSVTFSCTVGLDRSQWVSRQVGTATMLFDISYRYFAEKEATVTVRGIKDSYAGGDAKQAR